MSLEKAKKHGKMEKDYPIYAISVHIFRKKSVHPYKQTDRQTDKQTDRLQGKTNTPPPQKKKFAGGILIHRYLIYIWIFYILSRNGKCLFKRNTHYNVSIVHVYFIEKISTIPYQGLIEQTESLITHKLIYELNINIHKGSLNT